MQALLVSCRLAIELIRLHLLNNVSLDFEPFVTEQEQLGARFEPPYWWWFFESLKVDVRYRIAENNSPYYHLRNYAIDEAMDLALTEYFVSRLPAIRTKMRSANYPNAWTALLSREFFAWLFDPRNPVRRRGDAAAHRQQQAEVLRSLNKALSTNVLKDAVDTRSLNFMQTVKEVFVAGLSPP